jgi:hypothetical protein
VLNFSRYAFFDWQPDATLLELDRLLLGALDLSLSGPSHISHGCSVGIRIQNGSGK